MSSIQDDWEKPRSQGHHLTEEEKNLIRKGLRLGRPAKDVARELKCSTRVVCKYYVQFGRPKRNRGADEHGSRRVDGTGRVVTGRAVRVIAPKIQQRQQPSAPRPLAKEFFE